MAQKLNFYLKSQVIGSLNATAFRLDDGRLPVGNGFILEAKPFLGRSWDRTRNPSLQRSQGQFPPL